MTEEQRSGLFWPVILLAVGLLMLLQILGVMPEYLWDLLARLWPAALVLFGLAALIADRTPTTNALSIIGVSVLVVAIFAAGYTRQALQPADANQQAIDIDLENAGDISIRLDLSLTEVVIGAQAPGEAPGRLTGSFTGSTENMLTESYTLRGTQGLLTLTEASINPIPKLDAFGKNRLELHLPLDVPLKQFVVETQVGDITIDLTGVQLQLEERLNLKTGLGDVALTLPAESQVVGDLETGQGSIALYHPEVLPIAVTLDNQILFNWHIGNENLHEGLERLAEGPLKTEGYTLEDILVNITIHNRFGDIIIDYTP